LRAKATIHQYVTHEYPTSANPESFTVGSRVVVRWRYDWSGGHVRGVDVFTVADGKVAEKLAYVKG
jgi:hypothetical protein